MSVPAWFVIKRARKVYKVCISTKRVKLFTHGKWTQSNYTIKSRSWVSSPRLKQLLKLEIEKTLIGLSLFPFVLKLNSIVSTKRFLEIDFHISEWGKKCNIKINYRDKDTGNVCWTLLNQLIRSRLFFMILNLLRSRISTVLTLPFVP